MREVPVTSPARSSTAVFIPPGRVLATQKRLMHSEGHREWMAGADPGLHSSIPDSPLGLRPAFGAVQVGWSSALLPHAWSLAIPATCVGRNSGNRSIAQRASCASRLPFRGDPRGGGGFVITPISVHCPWTVDLLYSLESHRAAMCSCVDATGPVAPHVSHINEMGVSVPSSATCVTRLSFTLLHHGQGVLPVTLNICICCSTSRRFNSLIYPVIPVLLSNQKTFVLMTTTCMAVDMCLASTKRYIASGTAEPASHRFSRVTHTARHSPAVQ